MKTLQFLSARSCQILHGLKRCASKDAPQKMQFLGTIKKVATPFAFIQNAEAAEKSRLFGRHRSKIGPNPNVLAIKRPRTRSTAARKVSNTYERDLVTNQNV